MLDFLGAWRRTFAFTRTVTDREEESLTMSIVVQQSASHAGHSERTSFGENKIKNTNQASRQDKVENGDRISS